MQGTGNPVFDRLLSERNWTIVDAVREAARMLGWTPAEVALAWVTRRPGVSSTIVGATKVEQLDAAIVALARELPAEQAAQLDAVGRPASVHPYLFFETGMRAALAGGSNVRREPVGYRENL